MPLPENLDQEKLAEVALAILYLGSYSEKHGGVRAWKGMDWDLTNILHEKGWISDPVGKQKSVVMYDDAVELAEQFLKKHFGKWVLLHLHFLSSVSFVLINSLRRERNDVSLTCFLCF